MNKQDFLNLSTVKKLAFISNEAPQKKQVSSENKNEHLEFSETIKKGISHKNKNELREFSVTIKKEVNPEKGKAKLLQLARQIIGDNNNETKPDIILQLQNITGVNDTRANNGFNKMLEQKIISWGIEKRYYLTASTPF